MGWSFQHTPLKLNAAAGRARLKSMGRRHMAYFGDFIAWKWLGRSLFLWTGLRGWIYDHYQGVVYAVILALLILGWRLLFLFKDGFLGQSPGKMAFGLRVVNKSTGQPIGFADSFKRNLLLLLPIVGELIIWAQLHFGRRWFDNWVNCEVILEEEDDE